MPENAAPEINQKIIFHDAAGEFDETWLKGVDVHIERMNETGFWIGFDFPDGRRVMLNTGVYRGEWYFNLEEDALGDHQSASVCRPRNATKSAALVKANNDIQRLTELIGAISALFPDDAPHKHSESGVSLLDDVRDVIAERKRIAEERDAARTETAACVKFLETELGWEDFRAEGFIGESAVSSSTRNCQKLRAFLAAKGDHGVKVLAELSALRAELEAVKGESK